MNTSASVLVHGGTVVTMNDAFEIIAADLLLENGVIAGLGPGLQAPANATRIDATDCVVIPGLIQGHVHLGQALLRGLAEGRELLGWLRERIWPLEAAHDDDSAYWSGMLGAADCLLSGTTTVQDIGLVHGMDGIMRAIVDSGLRAVVGKCLMDVGQGVPPGLAQETEVALFEARAVHDTWEGAADGRITGLLCPRFILSCSEALWRGVVELSDDLGVAIHTHLLEHPDEEREVAEVLGEDQMAYLDRLGVFDRDLRIAHGVQFGPQHREVLRGRPMQVTHCPSANLKLGSGIADLGFLRDTPGMHVGIGCDGAPCNNDMDALEEIRLAALLQGYKQGPGRFSARDALGLATREGAAAIGMADRIGTLEIGKAADVAILDLSGPATFGPPPVDLYDRIVYAAARDCVRWVIVDGRIRVRPGEHPHGRQPGLDPEALRRRPAEAVAALIRRADL